MSERVLCVDDDAGMRRMLERTLAGRYDVDLANGVGEAGARLSSESFDLVLVDLQLADGDGYSLCRTIKERYPDTEVILITGSLSEPDEKLYRSLEEGAFYFLFKPFERRVLRALVERCFALRRARAAEAALTRKLSEDLARARLFQQQLVPKEPLIIEGWRVEGRFRPCEAVSGDFYFALVGPDRTPVVALGDVVGHGVRAAMYAGMLRTVVDTARRRDSSPSAVQKELTDAIDFFESEGFASLVYGTLLPGGRFCYFNAGHPPPLLLRRSGETIELSSTALILTPLLPPSVPESAEVALEPGERLLIFSDGVYEAVDARDAEWGTDALRDAFRRTKDLDAPRALDRILTELDAHAGGRPLMDDATVVLIEREG